MEIEVTANGALKTLNKIVKHDQKTSSVSLKYCMLDKDSLLLKVYSDSSFENNMDNIFQLGYFALLTYKL